MQHRLLLVRTPLQNGELSVVFVIFRFVVLAIVHCRGEQMGDAVKETRRVGGINIIWHLGACLGYGDRQ